VLLQLVSLDVQIKNMTGSLKTLIHVPAEYVDAANDAVKWAVALLVANLFNRRGGFLGMGATAFGQASDQRAVVTAFVLGAGFLVYQLLIARFIMFVPKAGQATYYIALKSS
jgi:hypothetical protein